MGTWAPSPGLGSEYFSVEDGRIVLNRPLTVRLPELVDGDPKTDLEGAISIRDANNVVHSSEFSDSDGNGKYDGDVRGKNNHYSETSGKFHRRPSYTPGGAQRARIVEEATASAFYTEIGKNYSGDTFADWIVCRYLNTGFHWFRVDHTTGNFVYGASPVDMATSRITLASGDVEIADSTSGLILKSPNGTRWRIKVSDDGILTTETVI